MGGKMHLVYNGVTVTTEKCGKDRKRLPERQQLIRVWEETEGTMVRHTIQNQPSLIWMWKEM